MKFLKAQTEKLIRYFSVFKSSKFVFEQRKCLPFVNNRRENNEVIDLMFIARQNDIKKFLTCTF